MGEEIQTMEEQKHIAELKSENAALKQQLSDAQSAIIRDGGDCDGCLGGNHAVIKKLEA